MNRRLFVTILLSAGLLVLAIIFWTRLNKRSPQVIARPAKLLPTPQTRVTPATKSSATSSTPTAPTASKSRDEAFKRYMERSSKDLGYDWKVPLNFYGQVVDDTGQPVAGATASLGWTTDDVTGYAKQQISSDALGLFSMTGEHGKHLTVRVEMKGYYTVGGGQGNFAFEYADPSNPDYHQPDEHHPVVFYLRRKGLGAAVKSKTLRTKLYADHPQVLVNFLTGFFHADGQLTITVDKPDYRTVRGRFPWSMTLSVAQGGLVETDEQFPFLAPANGYAQSTLIDMTDTSLPTYDIRVTRTYYFYLRDTNTYGHITVATSGDLPSLNVSYVYNPQAGNRVLEPAPSPTPGGY